MVCMTTYFRRLRELSKGKRVKSKRVKKKIMSKRKNKRVVCPKPSKADINRVMEAAGLLKDSVVDAQTKKIEILERSLKMNKELAERYHLELEKLKEDYKSLAAHFDGLCVERDMFERCLKSAENALVYKDKVIDRIKKKNAKRMAAKCEVIEVLNEEIAYQYKRRDKAEKLVEALGMTFESLKKKDGGYELLSVNKE